ncbi:LamG domain-containing protein [Candidatus Woesearchaeota archaeon]|nr:LamG domain-containing protein [Candidatus Woesearchaeota archaeon]
MLKKRRDILFRISIFVVISLLLIGVADIISARITGYSVFGNDASLERLTGNAASVASPKYTFSFENTLENNGIPTSAIQPEYVQGYINKAIKLPGTYGISADTKVGHLDKFTIEAWVKLDSNVPEGKYLPIITEHKIGGRGRYALYMMNGKEIIFHPNKAQYNIISYGNYLDQWTYIVVVVNRNDPQQKEILYVNGEKKAVANYYSPEKTIDSSYDFLIGKWDSKDPKYDATYFNGLIDEVKIYEDILTPQQIASNYISAREKNKIENALSACITDTDCITGKNCNAGVCTSTTNDETRKNEVRKKTHDIDDVKGLDIILNSALLAPSIYTTDGNSCNDVCRKASLERQEQIGEEKTLRVGESFNFKIGNLMHTIKFITLQDANTAKITFDNRVNLITKESKIINNVKIKILSVKDVQTSATADTITFVVMDSTPLALVDTGKYDCQASYSTVGAVVGCDEKIGARTCQCLKSDADTKVIIAKSRSGR